MVFNKVEYEASTHAVDEFIIRSRNPSLSFDEAKKIVTENLYNAKVIIEDDNNRYLKKDLFYYPCVKIIKNNKTVYLATTTLTRKMLEYGDSFDKALLKYSS